MDIAETLANSTWLAINQTIASSAWHAGLSLKSIFLVPNLLGLKHDFIDCLFEPLLINLASSNYKYKPIMSRPFQPYGQKNVISCQKLLISCQTLP